MPSVEWNRRWAEYLAVFRERNPDGLYGDQWGDPELRGLRYLVARWRKRRALPGPLYRVVDDYIRPHVTPDSTVLEIGSGGGRWTRYLVGAKKVIVVDISEVFFAELAQRFPAANFEFYRSGGADLRGVEDSIVDFAFSFGTFVHIDPEEIRQYLDELKRVLKPGGVAILQYADKRKRAARRNPAFSEMDAQRMEAMAPMRIIAHELRLLDHSNLVVFQK